MAAERSGSTKNVIVNFEYIDENGKDMVLQAEVEQTMASAIGEMDTSTISLVMQQLMKQPSSKILPKGGQVLQDMQESVGRGKQKEASNVFQTSVVCEDDTNTSLAAHIWCEKEIKLLLDLRLTQEHLFCSKTNHTTLWRRISQSMANEGVHVTATQAKDKFNYLKKEWRKVIDNNNTTGKEKKTWKYSNYFDDVYGTKASTKPTCTIESDSTQTEEHNAASEVEDQSGDKPLTPAKRPKTEKQSMKQQFLHIVQNMDQRSEKLHDELKKMHTDRMLRMDRFLDIISKTQPEK